MKGRILQMKSLTGLLLTICQPGQQTRCVSGASVVDPAPQHLRHSIRQSCHFLPGFEQINGFKTGERQCVFSAQRTAYILYKL